MIDTTESRLSQVVPVALEGSAKLCWSFISDFVSWDDFKTGFRAEFASIDAKRRHKDELRHRTQHPEENLKEFIYTIADFYKRIKQEVPASKEVDRVLRQMHPQLQDLVEGTQYANLSELAKAADGLTERAWWRLRAKAAPDKKQPGGPRDTRYSRTGSSSGCVISNSRYAVDVSLATPPCGNRTSLLQAPVFRTHNVRGSCRFSSADVSVASPY
ncbi:hypothetical protein HPB47_000696 [Ixodes persulcatus]|uniref:Uncharacterized protein n=1 Tax=Ixodes persulcatus TaxID=34615 RepID=A0AC60QZD4_IXOPE|nr:hypothetical protein HPB47_000696 [Ixodes persulcatus]